MVCLQYDDLQGLQLQAFPEDTIRRANTNAIKLERLKELFESITETKQEHNYVDALREVVQNELEKLQQQGAFC